jgi:hypothetical protein
MTFFFKNVMVIYPKKSEREEFLGVVILPVPAQDVNGPPFFIKFKIPEYYPYEKPHITIDMPKYYDWWKVSENIDAIMDKWNKAQRLINLAKDC